MSLRVVLQELSVRAAGQMLPRWALQSLFRRATKGFGLAVCVHRVGPTAGRRCNPAPEMTIAEARIDRLLELVRGAGREDSLSLTFDDGYADSVAYVERRARAYPGVQWLVFVCPEKLTQRSGFRWDHYELLRRRNLPTPPFGVFMAQDLDVHRENHRHDLREVARQPEFALATVEACKRLSTLSNVSLGGHTNTHFNLCLLSTQAAETELRESTLAFESAFGQPLHHFSFPFGTPGEHFTEAHVAYLQSLRKLTLWSTHQRPFAPDDRGRGAVLPRFAFRGAWSGEAMLVWMTLHALRARHWPQGALDATRALLRGPSAATEGDQIDDEALHSEVPWVCPEPPASATRYCPASLEAPTDTGAAQRTMPPAERAAPRPTSRG